MEPIKISLADAAKKRGCSVDYLLALAEAERLDIFARVEGFTATFKNWRGEPMPTLNKRGEPAVRLGPISIGAPSYTTLLSREAAILRSGNSVTVNVVREEGAENGICIPELSDELYLLWLAEPQRIGVEQVCVNENDGPTKAKPNEESATQPAAPAAIVVEVPKAGADSFDQGGKKNRRRWTDADHRTLYAQSIQPGMTPAKLADEYGVSRQAIEARIKKARAVCTADRRPGAASVGWKAGK